MSDLDPRAEAEALIDQALMTVGSSTPTSGWTAIAQVFAILHLADAVGANPVRVLPVTVRPLCADQAKPCACHACACDNEASEPGVPVCSSCIDNCDLSGEKSCETRPSLRDEVRRVIFDTEDDKYATAEDAVLAVVRRHVEALPCCECKGKGQASRHGVTDLIPCWVCSAGRAESPPVSRRDLLALLGGGDD